MPYVAVEGNVGAGKSTLLSLLARRGFTVVHESVDKWTDVRRRNEPGLMESAGAGAGGESNLLRCMYTDPARWGFTFQMKAMFDRHALYRSVVALWRRRWGLMERSCVSEKEIFVHRLLAERHMSPVEYAVYADYHDELTPGDRPDAVIYLEVEPEVCLTNVRARARPGEEVVDLGFLRSMHDAYRDFICRQSAEVPLLWLDGRRVFKQRGDGTLDLSDYVMNCLSTFETALGARLTGGGNGGGGEVD